MKQKGLHPNMTSREISAWKKKEEARRDLEDIDTSNIISGDTRSKRKRPPAGSYAIKHQKLDSDDDEEEEEAGEEEEEEEEEPNEEEYVDQEE
jgi:ribosomal protein L12E/L44/L45/RPP1/RPP2